MASFQWNRQTLASAVAVLAITAVAIADDKSEKPKVTRSVGSIVLSGQQPGTLTIQIPKEAGGQSVIFVPSDIAVNVQFAGAGKYWVGLNCAQVGDALRSHLQIAKGKGLLVLDVVPDSPAAKAKIQQHDVVLKVGKTDVGTIGHLTQAVQEAKTKAVSVQIIRKGKRQTLKVTPAERPKDATDVFPGGLPGGGELPRGVLEILKKHGLGRGANIKARFFGPGVAFPKGGVPGAGIGSVQLRIEKTNDGKAKITITKDGKTYTTTEDKLNTLPKDIRPIVERALKAQKGGQGLNFDFKIDGRKFSPRTGGVVIQRWHGGPWGNFQWRGMPGGGLLPMQMGAPGMGIARMQTASNQSLDKKLDAINKKLDALKKAIEELKPD